MRPFQLLAGNNDVRVLGIGQGDALFDLLTRQLGLRRGKKSDGKQSDGENGHLAGAGAFPNECPQNCLHANAGYCTFHAQIGRGVSSSDETLHITARLNLNAFKLTSVKLPHCILPQALRCG